MSEAASKDDWRSSTGYLDKRRHWEERVAGQRIELSELVQLKHAQTRDDPVEQALGEEFYEQALEAFKAAHRRDSIVPGTNVNVAIFAAAGCGVYLLPDGRFWYTVIERAIEFDWSAGMLLLNRIEGLAKRSRELWRIEPTAGPQPARAATRSRGRGPRGQKADEHRADGHGAGDRGDGHEADGWEEARQGKDRQGKDRHEADGRKEDGHEADGQRTGARGSRHETDQNALQARLARGLATRRLARERRTAAERGPHCERAYDLCCSIFSAINLEKLDRVKRMQAGESLRQEPSSAFVNRVELVRPEMDVAEAAFRDAAQRYAQGRYGRGMVVGVTVVGLICVALAIVFANEHIPAWYGVALLSGGVGAAVSVLQRMASGQLRLDYDAGSRTLTVLGAVRPLIGAVFGMVIFAAIDGGWLPAVQITRGHELAFYAVLGFLAGFNERFAQDMLVASAAQLSARAAPRHGAEAHADPPAQGALDVPARL